MGMGTPYPSTTHSRGAMTGLQKASGDKKTRGLLPGRILYPRSCLGRPGLQHLRGAHGCRRAQEEFSCRAAVMFQVRGECRQLQADTHTSPRPAKATATQHVPAMLRSCRPRQGGAGLRSCSATAGFCLHPILGAKICL